MEWAGWKAPANRHRCGVHSRHRACSPPKSNRASGLGGTFSITTTATTIASCSGATALAVGTPLTNQSIAAGVAAPTACLPGNTGPTVFYSLSVLAGEGRTVRVNSTGAPFNPSLRALDSCTGFETGATGFAGIEDATASDQSIGLGANTAGVISTTQAYRFTPQP